MATKKVTKKANAKATSMKNGDAGGGRTKTTKRSSASSDSGMKAPRVARQSKAAKPSAPVQSDRPKRVSGLDLAAEVLADSDKPLNAKMIAERVIAAGWKTSGLTPGATLYAAMVREITMKKDASRFKKTGRGLFMATRS